MHFADHHALVEPCCSPRPLRSPAAPPPTTASLPTPAGQQMLSNYPEANVVSESASSQQHPQHVQAQQQPQFIMYQGFDLDDMELNVDVSAPWSGALLPPDIPISTPLSSHPSPTPSVETYSDAFSPHASQLPSSISQFDATTVLPLRDAHHHSHHHHPHHPCHPARPAATCGVPEDAFNGYASYADYSSLLASIEPNASLFIQQGMSLEPMYDNQSNGQHGNGVVCTPMTLLLSGSGDNTPDSSPASSRHASPILGGSGVLVHKQNAQASSSDADLCSSSNAEASGSSSAARTARASTTLSRSTLSLLPLKQFKCPKPNCTKSYQQTNGLKYHMRQGSCSSAPSKDLEHVQELLANKWSEKATATGGEGEVTLSDAELREVKKEAERKLRPFACGVDHCQKRYTSMNGLNYHYRHSGVHSEIGFALIRSGLHECLPYNKSQHGTPSHCNSNAVLGIPHNYSQTHSRTVSQHSSPSQSHQPPPYVLEQSRPPTYQSASALANPPVYSYHPHPQPSTYAYAPQQYTTHAQQHYMPQTKQP